MTEQLPPEAAEQQLLRYWGCSPDDHHAMVAAEEVVRDAATGDALSLTELRCAARLDEEFPDE